ncbi:MAG: sle [Acidimicrobiaceae bacterium]|nr:sle [Acidimicrobiaceae bacterium]
MGVRVFLVDDHEVVRAGLRELLARSGEDLEVIGEAATAHDAVERIVACLPDVAVLDVRLADGDGIEVARDVRSRAPEVACLMLTAFADDEALAAAMMAGASGFVSKDVRGSELAQCVRRVAAGGSLLDASQTRRMLEAVRAGAQNDPLEHLTGQELRVLDLVGEGMTNRQIADELGLAEKTVKNYVSSVLTKLGMHRRTEAAVLVARRAERSARRARG